MTAAERLRVSRRRLLVVCAELAAEPGKQALYRAVEVVEASDRLAVEVLGRLASTLWRRWSREKVGAALVGAFEDCEPRLYLNGPAPQLKDPGMELGT